MQTGKYDVIVRWRRYNVHCTVHKFNNSHCVDIGVIQNDKTDEVVLEKDVPNFQAMVDAMHSDAYYQACAEWEQGRQDYEDDREPDDR